MATKIRKISLIDYRELGGMVHQKEPFKVEKITNSIEFRCGENLDQATVDRICTMTKYEVVVRMPKKSDFD